MISYKTYKLINENFGTPMAFGFSPAKPIGVHGSRLAEMGLRPDEMDDVEGEEDEEFDEFGNPIKKNKPEFGDEENPDDEESMDQEDGEDDLDHEISGNSDDMDDMGSDVSDAPFPPEEDDDMASLAGIGDPDMTDMEKPKPQMGMMSPDQGMDSPEGMDTRVEDPNFSLDSLNSDEDDEFSDDEEEEDFNDDEFGDEDFDDEEEDDDDEELGMNPDGLGMQSKKIPMESCDSNAKEKLFGKDGKDKKKDKSKKDEKDLKEDSFWNAFVKNASGTVRKVNFKEDSIIPPTNVNAPITSNTSSPQGIGNHQEPVRNDYFGFTSVEGIPSFHDYVEWRKTQEGKEING